MKKELFLGLDIGGTKVDGAVAFLDVSQNQFEVLSQQKILLQTPTTYENFLEDVFQLICDLVKKAGVEYSSLKALGAGLPGTLHPLTHVMLNGNTQYLVGKDFVGDLSKKLFGQFQTSRPLFVNNDANFFTLAEVALGAGKKYFEKYQIPFSQQIAVGITLGTGVGGGAVVEGKILSGAHGSALEVGHITLDPAGPLCYCGQRGCSELYLSGTGIQKKYEVKSAAEIFHRAEKGEPAALQILNEYRLRLLHFLSVINNLFNPHYFVFGGGLSQQSVLFQNLKEDLQQQIFLSPEYCPEIYMFQVSDSAGLFGAMLYASQKVK